MSAGLNDLEERTAVFAEAVRGFVRELQRTISNIEDVKQLVRSSGSVAANCIEQRGTRAQRLCLSRRLRCTRRTIYGCGYSVWVKTR